MQKNGFRGRIAGALSVLLTGAVLVGAMCFPGKSKKCALLAIFSKFDDERALPLPLDKNPTKYLPCKFRDSLSKHLNNLSKFTTA